MPIDAATLRIRVIRDSDALINLRSRWLALWRRIPGAHVFQHPDWLLAWWRLFGNERLLGLTFYSERQLVGILPLFKWSSSEAAIERTAFVGAGISDYLDILVDRDFEAEIARELPGCLQATSGSIEFHDVPAESLLWRTGWPSHFEVERSEFETTMHLGLGSSIERTIPAPQLQKLLYYRRRFSREQPGYKVERVEFPTVNAFFQELVRLHQRRWNNSGEPGVLADARVQEFHREVIGRFAAAGDLRGYALFIKNEPAAIFYGFAENKRTVFYLSGFAPEFARYNLGTLLVGHAIEAAIQERHTEFDFLRGPEAYKFSWGARPYSTFRLRLTLKCKGEKL